LQYSEGRTAPASCVIKKLVLEDAPITQIPQTFEQLRKLAVALKPAERYGFGISSRQGSAISSASHRGSIPQGAVR